MRQIDILADRDYAGGYSYIPGGITNQKLGLLGLFLAAKEKGLRKIVLPNLLVFDQKFDHGYSVPRSNIKNWFDYYDQNKLIEFADGIGIEILNGPVEEDTFGWPYYQLAFHTIHLAGTNKSFDAEGIIARFFRSLSLLREKFPLLDRMKAQLISMGRVSWCAQLRVEADWKKHTSYLAESIGEYEDFCIDYRRVLAKIRNTCGHDDQFSIYVAADENNIDISKSEINSASSKEFGFNLLWKSDFMTEGEISCSTVLELSMVDFEIAIACPFFVGQSRSSFSCAITYEKYFRQRQPIIGHYIYNVPGKLVAERSDNGACWAPQLASPEYYTLHRNAFYQGHALLEAGKLKEALSAYIKRSELRDAHNDELFISLYRSAKIMEMLDFASEDIVEKYRMAIDSTFFRAEAHHGLSRFLRSKQNWKEAFEIAVLGSKFSVPKIGTHIEKWVYDYGMRDELAVASFWCGEYKLCINICEELLLSSTTPLEMHERLNYNIMLSKSRLEAH